MAEISQISTKDGISWYCEQQGKGPHLILVPSGEGDCSCFVNLIPKLSSSFRVTTFDMPGFSRSIAPETALQDITGHLLASQIAHLMDELSIETATFYGSSSGGLAVLSLVAGFPERVRNALVHEVPMERHEQLENLKKLDDGGIVSACRNMFSNYMNEDQVAWEALGAEYHARLDKNYVVWVHKYINSKLTTSLDESRIGQRPVDWTIGALSQAGATFSNVVAACKAGIPISLLPSKHFPYVSVPDAVAQHIQTVTSKYL